MSLPSGTYSAFVETLDAFCPQRLPPRFDEAAIEPSRALAVSRFAALNSRIRQLGEGYPELKRFINSSSAFVYLDKHPFGRNFNSIEERASAAHSRMPIGQTFLASREIANFKIGQQDFLSLLSRVHQVVSQHSTPILSPGLFRSEEVLIQAGSRIDERTYIGPLPVDLPRCLVELEEYVEAPFDAYKEGLIRTLAVMYQIMAIHPFRDGNSRVAQQISELLLRQSGHLGRFPFALRPVMARYRSQLRPLYRDIEKKGEWEPYLVLGLRMLAQAADVTGAIISDLAMASKKSSS